MEVSGHESGEAGALREVLGFLENLTQTATGAVIYDQIARVVSDFETAQDRIEQTYSALLFALLDAYSRNPSSDHVLEVTARIIRMRQSAALSLPAIAALRAELLGEEAPEGGGPSDAMSKAANALLSGIGASRAATVVPLSTARPTPSPAPAPAPAAGAPQPVPAPPPAPAAPPIEPTPQSHEVEPQVAAPAAPSEEAELATYAPRRETELRVVPTDDRADLDRKREEFRRLQEALIEKLGDAIAQSTEFGTLLRIEREALEHAKSVQEIHSLREILISGVEELIAGQENLATKLRGSSDYLAMIRSDSDRLHDELSKVRLQSLTDESTGLSNRRAFMRRLEEEIGRSQRYATPLALVIIDLDGFKAVNDTHGHAAGDAVLRCYASNVLSIFRHHDMVARYGGEEFAVLLPNTALEGVQAAMRKVQARSGRTTCEYGNAMRPLPTFSAGLTMYVPGEPPNAFIDRSDRALYRAKRLGRNRVEVELAGGYTGAAPTPAPVPTLDQPAE
jgi:diguanylate cyclase (GGDEF)-like protein